MGTAWLKRLIATCVGLCGVALVAGADDPPSAIPLPRPPVATEAAAIVLPPLPSASTEPAASAVPVEPTRPADGRPARPDPLSSATEEIDPASVRQAANARLNVLPREKSKEETAASKTLRDVLSERLTWLDEWDQAVKERVEAENPKPSPEAQAAEWKADLERIRVTIAAAGEDPDAVIPASFRNLPSDVSEKTLGEMKEAIATALVELKDWTAKHEQFRAAAAHADASALAKVRASRDRAHQRVAGLRTRNAERESAVAAAKTPEALALARDRLVNFQWESRVENERLRGPGGSTRARDQAVGALDAQPSGS